ncbi:unnamed protein product [Linum trigynum]
MLLKIGAHLFPHFGNVSARGRLAAYYWLERRLETDDKVQPVVVNVLKESAHRASAECASVIFETDGKPWYYDILRYIEDKEYPEGASSNEKRTIRRLAAGYVLSGKVLYKRGYGNVLLRCDDSKEVRYIIREVHEGVCGTHATGHAIARKILRAGSYWQE